LLVEDDDEVAETVSETLVAEGYQVDRAANGAEGLSSLRTRPTPSLILLDWTMPVMNGQEMVTSMKHEPRWSKIPIVLLTASEEAKSKALAVRAAGYLKKPVDRDDLLRMVNAVLRETALLRSHRSAVSD
jgi:DNA-binding response OmpR family regulator